MKRPRFRLVPTAAITVILLSEAMRFAVAQTNVVSVLLSAGTSASPGHLALAGSFIVLRFVAILFAGPVLLAWLTLAGWKWIRFRLNRDTRPTTDN